MKGAVEYDWLSFLPVVKPPPFDDEGWQLARDRRRRQVVNIAAALAVALVLNALSFALVALLLN